MPVGVVEQTPARTLFDEAHRPVYSVDPSSVCGPGGGANAAGGYADMAQHILDNGNYEINITHERLTPEMLEDCDILVVPCSFSTYDPAADYADAEIDAIEQWVKAGGGLLLIADHSSFATDMDDIAARFGVRWGHNVVTDPDPEDYVGGTDYWIVFDEEDNMPLKHQPPDEDEIYKITENISRIEYYCSNAFVQESEEAKAPLITDSNANIPNEPALLAIPNGNVTGAGRAVFITDSNVFDNAEDCDNDGDLDFWDSDNEQLALNIIDWLAPRPYEISLISGEEDPITGLPKPLIDYIEPGETTEFDIEAWNLGLREDQITFELEGVPENWTAELSETETPTMESNDCFPFTLTVTAPDHDVGYDDYAMIRVHAQSVNDENATDYIDTYTFLEIRLDFDISFRVETDPASGKKEDTVDVGEPYQCSLGLTNLGNVNDTYDLELSGLPESWSWNLSETEISLGASRYGDASRTIIDLIVTPPLSASAGETVDIEIEVTSQLSCEIASSPMQRSDNLKLKVSAFQLIDIDCDEKNQRADPGASAQYVIRVTNNGNGYDTVLLEVDSTAIYQDEADDLDWTYAISHESIRIAPQATERVILTVYAPRTSMAGAKIPIAVEGRPQSGSATDEVGLTCTVNQIVAITVEAVDEESATGKPGETIAYEIAIENEGNGETIVAPSIAQMPRLWTHRFVETEPMIGGELNASDEDEIHRVTLKPWSSDTIWLLITLPEGALAGTYDLRINCSTEELYQHLEVETTVEQIYGITVNAGNDRLMTEAEPGRRRSFVFSFTNEGNGADTVTLECSDIVSSAGVTQNDWSYSFVAVATANDFSQETRIGHDFAEPIPALDYYDLEHQRVIETVSFTPGSSTTTTDTIDVALAPHQTVWAKLIINSPLTANRETYQTTLLATSSFGSSDESLTFAVRIKNSDLVIAQDIELSGRLVAGEFVSITVPVENRGDIAAFDVTVALYIDGERVASELIGKIEAGEESFVSFTWKADAGSHTIAVRADPDGKTTELHEDNNEKEIAETIEEGGGLFQPGFEVFQLLLALLFIAPIVETWRRRRH